MKYLKLKAYKDGSIGIEQNDLMFYVDNDAAELIVDFAAAEVDGLRKWVDFVMADGTERTLPATEDYITDDILTISLDNTITKTGALKLQPFANDPISGKRVNFEIIRIVVGSSLNVLNDTAYADPTPLEAALANKIDLDGLNSNIDELHFDITPTSTDALLAGQLRWNLTDGTLELGMNGGGIIQSIGLEQFYRVKNNSGSSIANGTLVMLNGSIGASGVVGIKPWDKVSNQYHILGIVTEDLAANQIGFITWHGIVHDVQTNGANYGETWLEGDVLYPSTSYIGGFTKVDNGKNPVGIVIRVHASAGMIYARAY